MTNGAPSTFNVVSSAQETLSSYVEEMLDKDRRFIGMSRYVFNINFFWSYSIDTACAGHGFIFFNPDFWQKLSEEKKKSTIAHEIMHLVLNHLERGVGFNPDDYNQAADHVINIGLERDQFDMQGDFGGITICCDHRFDGMSTEHVYQIIHKERKKNPNKHKPVQGTPSKDQIEDLVEEALKESQSGKDLQEQIEDNQKEVEEASKAMQQKGAPGSQTGHSDIIIQTENKKVFIKEATYEEIFEPWLTDPLSGGKRTYMRPSRRQIKGGLRLKGKFPKRGKKNRLTHLVYALDVSGSISNRDRKLFLASANTLKQKLNPALMTIILWNTSIKFEKTFREDEKLDNIRVQAGGGTSLNPVYKRVKQLNPEALVIFTDLQVSIPPEPSWDTIWFVSQKGINDHYLQQVKYGDVYLVPDS